MTSAEHDQAQPASLGRGNGSRKRQDNWPGVTQLVGAEGSRLEKEELQTAFLIGCAVAAAPFESHFSHLQDGKGFLGRQPKGIQQHLMKE